MQRLSVRGLLGVVLACSLVCLFLLAPGAMGQMGQQGTLNVIVMDQSGAAVEGANLELIDLSTNDVRNVVSQQLGVAIFPDVPLGKYKLTVSHDSFNSTVVDTVIIQGGRVTDLKVSLKIGSKNETVTVDAAALPLIETTSNALATTIDVKQIEDLPLSGRDVSTLAQLSPGFAGTPGGGTWNGLPVIAQSNTIDGVVASTSRMKFGGNVQPGLEARLPVVFDEMVSNGRFDVTKFVAWTSTNPAKIYGLYPKKGTLAIGSDADIAIWDPKKSVTFSDKTVKDRAGYTPWKGRTVKGWPTTVLLRGTVLVADDKLKADFKAWLLEPKNFRSGSGRSNSEETECSSRAGSAQAEPLNSTGRNRRNPSRCCHRSGDSDPPSGPGFRCRKNKYAALCPTGRQTHPCHSVRSCVRRE